ncbi:hypothetical protein KKD88_00670, partial [Patescibacteria group bacterium]|nr:hypothetical protein [Patescibacteria group bacterium]
KNNTDPSCYQRAYCASNLAKLRYARILPVGWEMAANSPYNTKKNGKYVTLEEVIRGFNVCNDNGDADDAHPWCKLIDPNWVLTAPPFQCRVKGYGDTVFSGASLRLEDCADAISCLKRDDRGKCTGGYGYCLAEKPVWRFTADECSEKFASCRTYQNSANERVSYLRNTLDYGSCNEDNVGCMWYSTLRDPADKEGATWIGKAADKTGPRAYFDGTVKTCSSGSDGCTKLLETEQNKSSLNLIPNSSFELASAPEKKDIRNWTYSDKTPQPDYELPTVDEGQAVAEGSRSFKPFMQASKGFVSDLIELSPLRTYTFSVYVRNVTSSSDGVLDLSLNLYKGKDTSAPVKEGPYYRSEGCTSPLNARPGFEQLISSDNGSDWLRLQCTFVSNDETGSGKITIYGSNILVDALQLEEAEFAAPFVDGANTQLSSVYLKVAPEEFACTGDSSDPPACKKYARVCRQIDTGCQGYKDVNNPSAPEIPATLSAADMCPATCVGYAEYRKQPSTFDLGKNVDPRLNDSEDDTIAHFIPAYAQSCTIQDAGCEEFTNVESAAEGGEQKAAFNYIRACEKPNENTETFFTWEGSDTTGYQLKTWSLIHDLSLTPMPPKIIEKMGPEGILKNPKSCNASSWQSGVDSDCRQFFNADGVAFYAYFSQTVISSPQCANFRLDNTHSDDCTKTGGSFNPQTGECLYKILPSQSRSCNAVSGGCRAYMGTAGRNASSIFEEDFRAGTSTLFTAGDLSNESVLVGDKSLKLTGNTPLATATEFPSYPNQLYSVSFWAKTTAPTSEEGIVKVDGEIVGIFPMEVDWRRYEFGPFSGSFTASTSTIEWLGLPNPTFIDQIRIERLNDVFFAVKDSWVTPAECDRTPEGLPQPQAMLGCRSYQDRNKQSMTVRSFGHLCREDVIGCKALIDTRNSSDPYKQTFEIKGTDQNLKTTKEAQAWEDLYLGTLTTTRSADRFIYLIDEPSARCSAEAASCRAFGKPKFTQDRLSLATPTSSAFETVYLIDDVGQYLTAEGEPNMLCRRDELFCDKFMSGKTTAYFRNPGNHTCEWRDKVMLKKNEDAGIPADGQYSGWFMKGQNQPCYPKVLSSGNTYLIQNSGDPGFTGWAGMCPIEQSECTEFRDTNDHSDPVHPSGKPYFFIHNQRLDLSSCGGKV